MRTYSSQSLQYPVVSIITITKNNPNGLTNTLQSIASLNSSPHHEVIVVNGGADIQTASVITSYSAHIKTVLTESKPGIYRAMNLGIQSAKGHWLIFMNSGDCFASSEALTDFNPHDNAYLVFAKAIKVDGTDHEFMTAPYPWCSMPTSHQAIFFKRDLLKIRPYKTRYTIAGDFEYMLWASKKALAVQPWNKVIAIVEPGGISSVSLLHRVIETYMIAIRYFPLNREMHRFYLLKLQWALRVRRSRKLNMQSGGI